MDGLLLGPYYVWGWLVWVQIVVVNCQVLFYVGGIVVGQYWLGLVFWWDLVGRELVWCDLVGLVDLFTIFCWILGRFFMENYYSDHYGSLEAQSNFNFKYKDRSRNY